MITPSIIYPAKYQIGWIGQLVSVQFCNDFTQFTGKYLNEKSTQNSDGLNEYKWQLILELNYSNIWIITNFLNVSNEKKVLHIESLQQRALPKKRKRMTKNSEELSHCNLNLCELVRFFLVPATSCIAHELSVSLSPP